MSAESSHGARGRTAVEVEHPVFGRGGAEVVIMHLLSALCEQFDVTVRTRGGFDLIELNRLSGTSVTSRDLTLIVDRRGAWLPIGLLRHAVYSIRSAAVRHSRTVRIAGARRGVWRRPAIHLLSAVPFQATQNAAMLPLRARLIGKLIEAFDGLLRSNSAEDVYIANSKWTRERWVGLVAGKIHVVYPPVPPATPGLSHARRANRVVVLGRIAREKEIESCIDIVEMARGDEPGLKLSIVGSASDGKYLATLHNKLKGRPWVEIQPPVTGRAKEQLLASSKWGLSACRVEAFGLATAEMASAGMVTVVPRGCGQAEIVADERLHYSTKREAANLLVRLVRDVQLAAALAARCRLVNGKFGVARFGEGVTRIVRTFDEGRLDD